MSVKARVNRHLARVPGATALARLTLETIRVCLRYRVTGLASEAGFFALLSLPPLVLGLFGGVGYVGRWLGQETVDEITGGIQTWAERFLTDTLITDALLPTVNDVLGRGRLDLISVGFVLSIWSGSRALNVFVDTISIMYGQSGVRGIVQTRALSLTLYLVSLVVGIIVIPLVLIGPTWLRALLPEELSFLFWLYWPVVTFMAVASLTTLYHVSTPRRTPWLRDMPGAVLTLVIWALASFVLRGTIAASLGGTSIYGPLSTPIVLLIWLYFLAIAVLIGAALNAAIRILWPVEERLSARARAVGWVKSEVRRRRTAEGATVAGEGGTTEGAGQAVGAGEPGAADHGAPAPAAGQGASAPAAGQGASAPAAGQGASAPAAAPTGAGKESGADHGEEPVAARSKRSRPLTPLPEDPQRAARKAARKAAQSTP